MLPDLLDVDQYNENLYQIINTANWSLKQKMYILKYICLYILRFILLFTSSLPFYNFLQVIGVVIGVGWVRNLHPKRGKGKSARGLDLIFPWVPWPWTITHFLYVQGYALSRKFSWILWFIIFFLTEVCLEVRRYKRPLFLNTWPAPFDTCPQVSQTRQKSGLRQEPIRTILARI